MRIIAGRYRGRKLSSVRDLSVRPTTDRVKQTIFDILSNRMGIAGIEVLDLFAGSGSLGLEALSRGAGRVVFVDKSRRSLRVLQENVARLGCEKLCTIHAADVFWYLRHARRSFDLIFVDPPYKLDEIGSLPRALFDSCVTREGTIVVMEHGKESAVDLPETMYEPTRKFFGQTTVLILRTKKEPAAAPRTAPSKSPEQERQ